MKQIVITLDMPDINALEKRGDKEAIAKVYVIKILVFNDIYELQPIDFEPGEPTRNLAKSIDLVAYGMTAVVEIVWTSFIRNQDPPGQLITRLDSSNLDESVVSSPYILENQMKPVHKPYISKIVIV